MSGEERDMRHVGKHNMKYQMLYMLLICLLTTLLTQTTLSTSSLKRILEPPSFTRKIFTGKITARSQEYSHNTTGHHTHTHMQTDCEDGDIVCRLQANPHSHISGRHLFMSFTVCCVPFLESYCEGRFASSAILKRRARADPETAVHEEGSSV